MYRIQLTSTLNLQPVAYLSIQQRKNLLVPLNLIRPNIVVPEANSRSSEALNWGEGSCDSNLLVLVFLCVEFKLRCGHALNKYFPLALTSTDYRHKNIISNRISCHYESCRYWVNQSNMSLCWVSADLNLSFASTEHISWSRAIGDTFFCFRISSCEVTYHQ